MHLLKVCTGLVSAASLLALAPLSVNAGVPKDLPYPSGGDLTAEQRERLVEIADKCPIHRTLTSRTIVETRLD